MQAWEERHSFREIVEADEASTAHLLPDRIEEAFNPCYQIRHVDELFERAGLVMYPEHKFRHLLFSLRFEP